MAVSIKDMAMAVAILGIISFILGIIAENTKVLYLLFCFHFNSLFKTFHWLYIYIRVYIYIYTHMYL